MIALDRVEARAGDFTLRDISFAVPSEAWGIVLGPAGSGKTTLLETIAGIRRTTSGRIELRGVDVTTLAPEQRRIGMVYQHAYLFPHLSVYGNIGFGTRDVAAAREVSQRLGADSLAGRPVASLSGGERQVVALARALARRPDILLLDEPFAALDPRRRTAIRAELRRMQREHRMTILQVTHDFIEAGTLGDIAIVLAEGTLAQVDAPGVLFRKPANVAVADFLGFENVFSGQVSAGTSEGAGHGVLEFRGSGIELIGLGQHPGGEGHAVIRAEDVVLARDAPGPSSARNVLHGRVLSVANDGILARITLDVGSSTLAAVITAGAATEMEFSPGAPAVATIKATAVHLC
ncbi:MAG: ABC transporter ATP-binding protein [Gemmatimonadota bacterium]|nr:ABC transporter ATP-binding protein [Gemmatimonadota bacterium]